MKKVQVIILKTLENVKTWQKFKKNVEKTRLALKSNLTARGKAELPKCLGTSDLRDGNYSIARYYINMPIPFMNLTALQKKTPF